MCAYIVLKFNNKYSLCFRILCNSIYIERTKRCLLYNPTLKKIYLFQLFPLTNNNICCYS